VSSEPSTEALALFAMSWLSRLTPLGPIIDPWSALRGWRNGGRSHPLTLRVASENAVNEVKVSGSLDSATVAIDGGLVLATRLAQRDHEEYLTLDSENTSGPVSDRRCNDLGQCRWRDVALVEEDVASRVRDAAAFSNDVRSPMLARW